MYSHYLVPTDGSKLSDKAIAHAIALARATKGRITLFHAAPGYPDPVYMEGMAVPRVSPREYAAVAGAAAEKVVARGAAKVTAAKVACDTLYALDDSPWKAILDAAKKAKADTIVMASHGRRGLAGFLLGSETTKVLTHSKLPVLVVR
ncbi:MAG: universal stress protein [Burkholderiales bacterium]|nr:universal stress protein [Burkholderiales bacterium]